jgi:hypothetical protein
VVDVWGGFADAELDLAAFCHPANTRAVNCLSGHPGQINQTLTKSPDLCSTSTAVPDPRCATVRAALH